MKPEQKVQELMEQYIEGDWDDLFPAIVKLLKEQDRDTRHACAEDIITKHSGIFVDTNISYDDLDIIHSDIMDCTGGLE